MSLWKIKFKLSLIVLSLLLISSIHFGYKQNFVLNAMDSKAPPAPPAPPAPAAPSAPAMPLAPAAQPAPKPAGVAPLDRGDLLSQIKAGRELKKTGPNVATGATATPPKPAGPAKPAGAAPLDRGDLLSQIQARKELKKTGVDVTAGATATPAKPAGEPQPTAHKKAPESKPKTTIFTDKDKDNLMKSWEYQSSEEFINILDLIITLNPEEETKDDTIFFAKADAVFDTERITKLYEENRPAAEKTLEQILIALYEQANLYNEKIGPEDKLLKKKIVKLEDKIIEFIRIYEIRISNKISSQQPSSSAVHANLLQDSLNKTRKVLADEDDDGGNDSDDEMDDDF